MAAKKPNVAALVEQMPETDNDIKARQEEAKAQAQPDAPDKPKPKADRLGAASKFTGPDPAAAEKVFAEILSGGRESVTELLGLVREPGDADYKNYKASYVLHGVVLLAGRTGRETERKLVGDALAAQLGGGKHSKAVKGFFIRELRVLGDKAAVKALGAQLLDEDLCGDATQALLTIGDGAAAEFRRALDKAQERNRVTILHALGTLRDGESAAALRKAFGEEQGDAHRTAAWALANIGDAASADALIKAADSAEVWERTEATRNCLLLAERLAVLGRHLEAKRVYTHLRDTRTASNERPFREAAEKALGTLPR